MSAPLSDYELDELLNLCPQNLLNSVRRLLEEVRELRDQAAEREFYHSQEHEC